MERVIKSFGSDGGYCTDGCQWTDCSFLFVEHDGQQKCRLFGNANIFGGKSLNVCDKIYGINYEGQP